MDVNDDFVDIASGFIDNGVEFLIVGAYALAAFGAPVAAHGVSERDFEVEDKVYQLGLPPRRIDILTSISGVSFDEAAADAIEGNLGPVKVRFIGRAAMARNKLASGRPKDLVDAELLQSDD